MDLNIFGEALEPCCFNPLTGWDRSGYCGFHKDDMGLHLVCIEATPGFLEFSKDTGNDLSTPTSVFPGLQAGDRWCICVNRYIEALNADKAPKINLKATNIKVLEYIPLPLLRQIM